MQDLVLKAGLAGLTSLQRWELTRPATATMIVLAEKVRPARNGHRTEQGGNAPPSSPDDAFVCEQHTNTIRQHHRKNRPEPGAHPASCSHTHSAPHTRLRKTISGGVSHIENGRAYVVSVIPKIVEAVQLACDSLTACKVGFAQTESSTGVSRRAVHVDGAVSFEGGPNDVFDSTMTVVHFKDAATGDNRGIIVHYGAHNTALGATREVSRDWCGIMKDRIESQFKAPVLFLNGSEGDTAASKSCPAALHAGGGDGIESVCMVIERY